MGTNSPSVSEIATRTRWYIRLRWFLVLALTISGVLSLYIGTGWTPEVQRIALFGLSGFVSNVIFYLLARRSRGEAYYRVLASGVIACDVLLVTLLIFTNGGGVESRSLIMYAIPILMSAAILGSTAVYITSISTAVLYDSFILLEYFGMFRSGGALTDWGRDLPTVLNTVLLFGSILLIVGFLSDYLTKILASKEKQASESEEALKRVQSVAKLGSWERDLKTDELVWSDELYKIFGIKQEAGAISFKKLLKRVHPDDRKSLKEVTRLAIMEGRPFSFEYRITLPNKNIRIIQTQGQVVTDKRGKPIKLSGTARDITADHSLESAKADFVSLASHQLRTPATNVKILLSLLAEGYTGKLKADQLDIVRQAYDANERQLKIANDLLNVARVEAGRVKLKKKPIELGEWLQDLLVEQRSLIGNKDQELVTRIPKKKIKVMADPERLYMVMDNLLSNASKYTPPKGLISITLNSSSTHARIRVKDNGVGIAKSQQSKLFQKFNRIDNRLSGDSEGSGLGLYLVKNLIDLHKGEIKVTSKPKVGTTMTVLLPLAKK